MEDVDADGKAGSRRGAAQSGKRSRGVQRADGGAAVVLTVTAMEALFFNVRPAISMN